MMPVPVSESGLVTTRRPVPALTPRQNDVLRLAARGMTYRAVAHELGIAQGTVKPTLHDIYVRLDVPGLLDALRVVGWLVGSGEDDGSTWTVTTAGCESVTLP